MRPRSTGPSGITTTSTTTTPFSSGPRHPRRLFLYCSTLLTLLVLVISQVQGLAIASPHGLDRQDHPLLHSSEPSAAEAAAAAVAGTSRLWKRTPEEDESLHRKPHSRYGDTGSPPPEGQLRTDAKESSQGQGQGFEKRATVEIKRGTKHGEETDSVRITKRDLFSHLKFEKVQGGGRHKEDDNDWNMAGDGEEEEERMLSRYGEEDDEELDRDFESRGGSLLSALSDGDPILIEPVYPSVDLFDVDDDEEGEEEYDEGDFGDMIGIMDGEDGEYEEGTDEENDRRRMMMLSKGHWVVDEWEEELEGEMDELMDWFEDSGEMGMREKKPSSSSSSLLAKAKVFGTKGLRVQRPSGNQQDSEASPFQRLFSESWLF